MPNTPSPRRRLAACALAVVVVLAAPACSSDDGDAAPADADRTTTTGRDGGGAPGTDEEPADATEADYVAALVANFERSGDVFSTDGVRCLASRWVEIIGVDTFRDGGIAPDDLAANQARFEDLDMDRATATALADSFGTCDLALRDAYLRTLEGDLSEQGAICVDELLTEDAVRRSFVADLLGEALDPDPLTDVERCTR